MEQTKEEVITNLYALRAGLSIASQISESTKNTKKRIDEINYTEIRAIEKKVDNIQNDIEKETQELRQPIRSAEGIIGNTKGEIKRLEKLRDEQKGTRRSLLSSLYITLIAVLAAVVLFKLHYYPWGGISTLVAIVSGITFFSYGSACNNSDDGTTFFRVLFRIDLDKTKKALSSRQKKIIETQQKKEKAEQEFKIRKEKLHKKYKQLKEDWGKRKIELENERLECEAIVMVEQEKFEMVYKSLQNQFSSFLDERDWGNVDLIIYNYETGRALDLRDALLQVDNERRNQKLVMAVREATRSISYSISQGFGSMQKALSEKFDVLNNSISNSMYAIGGKVSQMIEQNKVVGEKLQEISSISSAQVALQQKMNTSSDQMAKDIDYMRELNYRTFYGV